MPIRIRFIQNTITRPCLQNQTTQNGVVYIKAKPTGVLERVGFNILYLLLPSAWWAGID